MAFKVIFSAKNVPRFNFGLLVAPKLKNKVRAIMAPTRSFMSFQSPVQIGLILIEKSVKINKHCPMFIRYLVQNSKPSKTTNSCGNCYYWCMRSLQEHEIGSYSSEKKLGPALLFVFFLVIQHLKVSIIVICCKCTVM